MTNRNEEAKIEDEAKPKSISIDDLAEPDLERDPDPFRDPDVIDYTTHFRPDALWSISNLPEFENFNIPRYAGASLPDFKEQQASRQTRRRTLESEEIPSFRSEQARFEKLSQHFRRVESGFKFLPRGINEYVRYHIEPLMDQAADLLDRGIKTRASWDDLSSKWLNSLIELGQTTDIEEVAEAEIRAGAFDTDWMSSIAQFRATQQEAQSSYNAAKMVDGTASAAFDLGTSVELKVNRKELAWVSSLPVLKLQHGEDEFEPEFLTYRVDGLEADVPEHMRILTGRLTDIENREKISNYQKEYMSYYGQATARLEMLKTLRAKAVFEVKNSEFKRDRFLINRHYRNVRSAATLAEDGVLNLGKRLNAMQETFYADFEQALLRLHSVESALSDIYGYDVPLPREYSDIDYFDKVLIWTRNTIHWILRFARLDQNGVLAISLRKELGEDGWQTGLRQKEFDFDLNARHFSHMRHVRLRGVSACVDVGASANNLYEALLQPPPQALIQHLDNRCVDLDQKHTPRVRMGRILGRASVREPDIVGTAILHNLSPIGSWKLSINSATWRDVDLSNVEDIQIDLVLAYRFVSEK